MSKRTRTPLNLTDAEERNLKQTRLGVDQPFQERLSSAVDLKDAIGKIEDLKPIGHLPVLVDIYRKKMGDGDDDENETTLPKKLTVAYCSARTGDLKSSFKLCITRPGCEYDSSIVRFSHDLARLLPKIYDNATISGYGDLKTLSTVVDESVRNAREILPTEFSVEPALLEEVQQTWADYFLPTQVRAEPYKIHIYGPGGRFKPHRDTPEKGLVGTFLVGLGETSWGPGCFLIDDLALRANPGSWVAFHPDVPHSVQEVESGHRAVIAFKIFRTGNNVEADMSQEIRDSLRAGLDEIKVPYGILLDRKYCMGTTEMNGFDALLVASARALPGVRVQILPVVATFHGTHDSEGDSNNEHSAVYPLTESHVDLALQRNIEAASERVRWLDKVHDIPFYVIPDIKRSTYVWSRHEQDEVEYTGNSSEPASEDSIYLSYAMLVLPLNHEAFKEESQNISSSTPA